ncbi:hypothetical protein Tcan_00840, partial [Toxocara canis]
MMSVIPHFVQIWPVFTISRSSQTRQPSSGIFHPGSTSTFRQTRAVVNHIQTCSYQTITITCAMYYGQLIGRRWMVDFAISRNIRDLPTLHYSLTFQDTCMRTVEMKVYTNFDVCKARTAMLL